MVFAESKKILRGRMDSGMKERKNMVLVGTLLEKMAGEDIRGLCPLPASVPHLNFQHQLKGDPVLHRAQPASTRSGGLAKALREQAQDSGHLC